MESYHIISDKQLDLPIIWDIILTEKKLKLSEEAKVTQEVIFCLKFLYIYLEIETKTKQSGLNLMVAIRIVAAI